jgi:hypothetical protein
MLVNKNGGVGLPNVEYPAIYGENLVDRRRKVSFPDVPDDEKEPITKNS